jgi:hypothetical protein
MAAALQLTRRSVIAGALAAPGMPLTGQALVPMSSEWDRALEAYFAARKRHERFLAEVLDPAVRLARAAGKGLTAQISALEDRGNDLCAERHDALGRMIAAPAGDLDALRLKLRLAYEEVLRFDDCDDWLRSMLADLDRLLS